MPQVPPEVLRAVQVALELYVEVVEASDMTGSSKQTYIGHARQFVRWLDDDFEPGAHVRG